MRRTILLGGILAAFALMACGRPADTVPADTAPAEPEAPASEPVGTGVAATAPLRAFGNEPFWSMRDVGGGMLEFSTPELPDGTRYAATRSADASGIHYAGANVQLDIVPGDCSDGMSDNVHPYSATMTLDGTSYSGCAAPVSANGEAAEEVSPTR